MSAVVTICMRDRIVMAADSRSTLTYKYPEVKTEVEHKDGIKKIFQLGERNIGILWFGNARIGDEDVAHYLIGLSKRVKDDAKIEHIATMINKECNERVKGEAIG